MAPLREPHHPSTRRRTFFLAGATALAIATTVPCQNEKSATSLSAEALFARGHLVDVKIEVAEKDWEVLCSQSRDLASALSKELGKRPFTWFPATVTIDGVRIERVGLRKKGFFGSLDDERPSLKIKFDQYVERKPPKGLDRITLNNNKQDASQACAVLSYALFRKAGVAAPRCNFAKVSVNGRPLGIYSNVESMKGPFLKQAFGDDSGAFYEGTVADFFVDRLDKFQLKNKAAKAEALLPLAKALAADPVDMKTVAQELDVDAFLRFWAMESLVSFWDGYANNQNNYYLYRHPENNKLYFVPWGMDSSFTSRLPMAPYFLKNKTILHQSVLTNRLYRVTEIRDRYKKTFENLLEKIWVEEDLIAETERIEGIVKDHLHERQMKFAGAMRKIRSWIKSRRKILGRELKKWPLRITTGPRNPLYFKPVGEASGTFSTSWHEGSVSSPKFGRNEADIKVTIDGKPVKFKRVNVTSMQSNWPTLDGGPKPPAIMFAGTREPDGKRIVLMLTPGRAEFRGGHNRPIVCQGACIVGQFGFLDVKGMTMVGGTVKLKEAGMSPGDKVVGEFTVKLVKMSGGDSPRYEPKDDR